MSDAITSKYKFDGIGAASASTVMAALLATPSMAWITAGLGGQIVFWILSKFFSAIASAGVVILNVGAMKVESAIDKAAYDGSLESAQKLLDAIRAEHRAITPAETKAIDDPVIAALRKFGRFGRPR